MSGSAVADATSEPSAPGWFGKLPALGDFASRRLPAQFVEPWDLWLRHSIAASRDQLADRWLETFLKSPIWRFAVLEDVCGPRAWAGILMPSVDKVGRYFPLTLAQPMSSGAALLRFLPLGDDWYAALEAAALSSLDATAPFETIEERLADLPVAQDLPMGTEPAAFGRWWAGETSSVAIMSPRDLSSLLTDGALTAVAGANRGRTLWWTRGDLDAQGCYFGFRGLPPPDQFSVLMTARPPRDE